MVSMPRIRVLDGPDAVGHDHVRAGVQLLRIEPLPPCALAVFLPEPERVVAHACAVAFRVVTVRGLEPVPRVRRVIGDAKTQPMLTREPRPGADDVLLRPDAGRVPRIVR